MSIFKASSLYRLSLFCFATLCVLVVHADDIRIANTANRKGASQYEWKIYVVADSNVLDAIRSVEYLLHPSLPDPVRKSETRSEDFAITFDGSSEFNVIATIEYTDGRKQILEHFLTTLPRMVPGTAPDAVAAAAELQIEPKLAELKPPDVGVESGHGKVTPSSTVRKLSTTQWEWEVFVIGEDVDLNNIECV